MAGMASSGEVRTGFVGFGVFWQVWWCQVRSGGVRNGLVWFGRYGELR